MSLHDKLNQSMSDRNVGDYLDLLHENFVATFHKSGDTFSKNGMGAYGFRDDGK